jgi:hypothetical protein
MIMIDPKMLELSVYEGIPHLLSPVVTDMKQAANALRWCVAEMERRYQLMSALGRAQHRRLQPQGQGCDRTRASRSRIRSACRSVAQGVPGIVAEDVPILTRCRSSW